MSECPVCGKGGVAEEATQCPQCQADLECFALLDALQEAGPAPAPDSQDQARPSAPARAARDDLRVNRGARWGLLPVGPVLGLLVLSMLLAVLVLQVLAFRQHPVAPAVALPAPETDSTRVALQAMAERMARLAARLVAIEGQLRELDTWRDAVLSQTAATNRQVANVAALVQAAQDAPAPVSATTASLATPAQSTPGDARIPDAWREDAPPGRPPATKPTPRPPPTPVPHHHLRPGETLWSLAKRYYGRGWLYPVLIVQNPGLGVYHQGGRVLRLFADPAQALDLYRQITPPGAERRLFRYRVQPGDDWQGLARRFLGRAHRAPELTARNPGSALTPGSQILIPLE